MSLPSSSSLAASVLLGGCLSAGFCASAEAFSPLSGPVLSNTAVPPNVVMLFDNSSSMVLNSVSGSSATRLDVARAAAKQLIADNRQVRFGLFAFRDTQGHGASRDAPGGQLLVEVGSIAEQSQGGPERFDALYAELDRMAPRASGNYTYTPLAESYYELTRYMRGLRAFYPQSLSSASRSRFTSPIQYRCQRNFGLIVTDGLPTYDSQFPSTGAADPDGDNPLVPGAFNLPDWDGQTSGDVSDDDLSAEGSTFYLDDIAAFAYETDLRSASSVAGALDLADKSFDDPAFPKQTMRTYTVGFAVDDPRLRSVAEAGNGAYYTASNRSELSRALNSALTEINASAGSGGGGVSSSGELNDGSLFYRTFYDPQGWTGSVHAYRLGEAGQIGALAWSTDSTVTSQNRASTYQTWRQGVADRPGSVAALNGTTYSQLSDAQQSVLDAEAMLAGFEGHSAGQQLLDWARGDASTTGRSRPVLMGDIINSPVLLASDSEPLAATNAADYGSYRTLKRRDMVASLVAGSNDGLLHVIGAADGRHRYAYLPAAMYSHLGDRARADFGSVHESGVDGPITLADARFEDAWTTLAVAGLGAGGKGLFAVRLFDQLQGNQALGALWEVSALDQGWEDLGFTYAKPAVGAVDGRSVIVSGNGYGSVNGQAVLYVVDAQTGEQLSRIPVGEAGDNGLSSPSLLTDAQGSLVAAYAGDLKGHLWKFDLRGDIDTWSAAFEEQPLFSAGEGSAITVQPQLVAHPQGGQLVLFGTGKFVEALDIADRSQQAFFAVWDKPDGDGGVLPEDLLQQQIERQFQRGGQWYRSVSRKRVDWANQSGWMLPLIHDGVRQGERVTRSFLTQGSRVIFSTGLIKDAAGDPCVTRGDGWLMVLDLYAGGALPHAVIDSNNDGVVDQSDEPVSGLELDVGLPGRLNLVRREPPPPPDCEEGQPCECEQADECPPPPPCGEEYYLLPGSDGVASVVGNTLCEFKRIMWRQLM